jgi:hypothetical protein
LIAVKQRSVVSVVAYTAISIDTGIATRIAAASVLTEPAVIPAVAANSTLYCIPNRTLQPGSTQRRSAKIP